VVCTKPLIDDLSKAQGLIALSEQTGKKVFVGQSSRFFEPMKRQRHDYNAGEIGKLVTVEAYYHADHRWFLGKGWSLEDSFKWLYGGMSHPVDLVRWYLPDIVEVMGYGMLSPNGKAGGLKNADTMHFIFKAADGRVARVSGVYSGPVQPTVRDSEMSCSLRGTEGCSQADYMDLRYAITNKTGEEKLITFDHMLKHYFRFEGKSHHAGEYQNYLDYYADCLNTGQTAYPDLREGLGTVAVLQAMERSLQSGKPEQVQREF
jgi:predicted dehydrogenase